MSYAFQHQWIKQNPGITTNGKMPVDIDLEQALTCCELSVVSYRHFTRGKAVTPKTFAFEKQHIEKYAKVFGFQCKVLSTASQQCVIFYNNREVVVAFEGSSRTQLTHYNRNLSSYFLSMFKEAPAAIVNAAREATGRNDITAKVHWGFDNALDQPLVDRTNTPLWQAIRREIETIMQQKPDRQLYLTGHSSGGALATIATARIIDELPHRHISGLYTFGQPRVGGKYFRAGLEKTLGPRYFRFEQYGDPMPALPPHNEEEYVHAGHWIPIDTRGNVLRVNDAIAASDTLSRSDAQWTSTIGKAYGVLMSGLSAIGSGLSAIGMSIADRNEILRDMFRTFDPLARNTHSTLRNLFNAQNYSLHTATTYSSSLHEHLKQRWHSPRRRTMLAEREGQDVLYHLQSLEDVLRDAPQFKLPQTATDAIQTLERKLSQCLNEWEMTQAHPPQVWLMRSQYLQDAADSPKSSFFQWFMGTADTSIKPPEEMNDAPGSNGSGRMFSAARSVRAIQRASRIEQVCEAINQFRHEIGHLTADPTSHRYLLELAEQADAAFAITSQCSHSMSRGIRGGAFVLGG